MNVLKPSDPGPLCRECYRALTDGHCYVCHPKLPLHLAGARGAALSDFWAKRISAAEALVRIGEVRLPSISAESRLERRKENDSDRR